MKIDSPDFDVIPDSNGDYFNELSDDQHYLRLHDDEPMLFLEITASAVFPTGFFFNSSNFLISEVEEYLLGGFVYFSSLSDSIIFI